MSHAIIILDTVFKAIEYLGGSINSDLSVKINSDIVRFRMAESQDQVKHELSLLLRQEKELTDKVAKGVSFEELEK